MPDLQNYAKEQIAKIVPEFDNLELRVNHPNQYSK